MIAQLGSLARTSDLAWCKQTGESKHQMCKLGCIKKCRSINDTPARHEWQLHPGGGTAAHPSDLAGTPVQAPQGRCFEFEIMIKFGPVLPCIGWLPSSTRHPLDGVHMCISRVQQRKGRPPATAAWPSRPRPMTPCTARHSIPDQVRSYPPLHAAEACLLSLATPCMHATVDERWRRAADESACSCRHQGQQVEGVVPLIQNMQCSSDGQLVAGP